VGDALKTIQFAGAVLVCVEERRGEFGEGHICVGRVFPSGVASENVPGQQDHRLGLGVDGHATDGYMEGRLGS